MDGRSKAELMRDRLQMVRAVQGGNGPDVALVELFEHRPSFADLDWVQEKVLDSGKIVAWLKENGMTDPERLAWYASGDEAQNVRRRQAMEVIGRAREVLTSFEKNAPLRSAMARLRRIDPGEARSGDDLGS